MSKKSTIVSCAIVVSLIIAFGVRWFIRAQTQSARYSCVAALRAIDGMKQTWALEFHKTTNDVPRWDDLAKQSGKAEWRWECPDGGVYTIGRVGDHPSCSIGGSSHTLR